MDSERLEEREEGPLALDLDPPIPANPRPGSRTIVATVAEYGRWRLSRVGLTPDDAIEEELEGVRPMIDVTPEMGFELHSFGDGIFSGE